MWHREDKKPLHWHKAGKRIQQTDRERYSINTFMVIFSLAKVTCFLSFSNVSTFTSWPSGSNTNGLRLDVLPYYT